MARDFKNHDNIVQPSNDLPDGGILDATPSTAGTDLDEKVHGDFIQFYLKMLRDTGIEANGLQDNTTNGFQYNEALKLMQGVSWFNTSQASGVDVGKFTLIYEMTLNKNFEAQRLSFDIYSYGSTSAKNRRAKIDIHTKIQSVLPYGSFASQGSVVVTRSNSIDFTSDNFRIILLTDSDTEKKFGVYVSWKHNFEVMYMITRTNIGGVLKQYKASSTEVALPSGTQYNFKEVYQDSSIVFSSAVLGGISGTISIVQSVAIKRGGMVYINGTVDASSIANLAIGTSFFIDFNLKSAFHIDNDNIGANINPTIGSAAFIGNGSGVGIVNYSFAVPTIIRAIFKVTEATAGNLALNFSCVYPALR